MKLTDLKDLRFIKKSLDPQPEQKPQQNQPRKRSVVLKSREEERARNEGLTMGQKVRMMDTNDTATITGFGKDYYELSPSMPRKTGASAMPSRPAVTRLPRKGPYLRTTPVTSP